MGVTRGCDDGMLVDGMLAAGMLADGMLAVATLPPGIPDGVTADKARTTSGARASGARAPDTAPSSGTAGAPTRTGATRTGAPHASRGNTAAALNGVTFAPAELHSEVEYRGSTKRSLLMRVGGRMRAEEAILLWRVIRILDNRNSMDKSSCSMGNREVVSCGVHLKPLRTERSELRYNNILNREKYCDFGIYRCRELKLFASEIDSNINVLNGNEI
jgi:hypothetical protein